MPFINSKITKKISRDEELIVKDRLGKAIELIPGKSEAWLMLNFEAESHLYFKGSNDKDIAYVEVSVFGSENKEAFNNFTAEITKIFNEVLGIEPERIYVKYETTTNWGWNGGNF